MQTLRSRWHLRRPSRPPLTQVHQPRSQQRSCQYPGELPFPQVPTRRHRMPVRAPSGRTRARGCRSGSTTSTVSTNDASRSASTSRTHRPMSLGASARCTCVIPTGTSSASAERAATRLPNPGRSTAERPRQVTCATSAISPAPDTRSVRRRAQEPSPKGGKSVPDVLASSRAPLRGGPADRP